MIQSCLANKIQIIGTIIYCKLYGALYKYIWIVFHHEQNNKLRVASSLFFLFFSAPLTQVFGSFCTLFEWGGTFYLYATDIKRNHYVYVWCKFLESGCFLENQFGRLDKQCLYVYVFNKLSQSQLWDRNVVFFLFYVSKMYIFRQAV